MRMYTRQMFTRLVPIAAALCCSAGCGLINTDPRLTNGGGGNLLTAIAKLTQGNLGGLTQDELQQLADQARSAIISSNPNAAVLPQLTDAQADALLAFYNANGLTSLDGINAFRDSVMMNPLSVKGLPELAAALLGQTQINLNPATFSPADAEKLLASVFTGSGVGG